MKPVLTVWILSPTTAAELICLFLIVALELPMHANQVCLLFIQRL